MRDGGTVFRLRSGHQRLDTNTISLGQKRIPPLTKQTAKQTKSRQKSKPQNRTIKKNPYASATVMVPVGTGYQESRCVHETTRIFPSLFQPGIYLSDLPFPNPLYLGCKIQSSKLLP